jgi:hypothetical protein
VRGVKRILALTLAAAAGCSGSADPCAELTKDFLLQGTRFSDQVDMTWSGADAGSYQIWAFGGAKQNIFENPVATVSEKGVNIGLTPDLGTVVFEARPMAGATACPTPDSALTVPQQPALSATAVDGGVQLDWIADQAYGSAAQIGRGSDEDHIQTIATADAGAYLDSTAELGTTYTYALEMRATNLIALSTPQTVLTFPATPEVTATPRAGAVALSWLQTDALKDCVVTSVAPPGAQIDVPSGGSAVAPCPFGVDCSFSVQCFDFGGHASGLGLVSGRSVPLPPAGCAAASLSGRVDLSWSASAGASQYVVQRVTLAGVASVLANTAGTAFSDSSSPLMEIASYQIFAADASGAFDALDFCAPRNFATRGTAPGPLNLGPSNGNFGHLDDQETPGQTFVVTTGGQLMGIELPDTGGCMSVYTDGEPRDASPMCVFELGMGDTFHFAADVIQGVYYDLSAQQILVSPGQTIGFEIHDVVNSPETSADALPGNATEYGGSSDADEDVLFKAFVLPSSDLPAPRLTLRVAGPTAFLSWTASPAALGYDVLDGGGSVLLHTAETHAALSIASAAGAAFQVRAAAAGGASVSSNQVTAVATSIIGDAANPCDAVSGAVPDEFLIAPDQVTQTFKAVHTGLLSLVEVEASADSLLDRDGQAGTLPAQIEDENGNVLASFLVPHAPPPAPYVFRPISPNLPGANAADVSGSGVHVTAGQSLRLVLGPAQGSVSFSYRDGPDIYPDGEAMFSNATATDPRDLCFKIYVDPSR